MATVLVTGANRGLGLEFARQYAADGWEVIGDRATTGKKSTSLQQTCIQAFESHVHELDIADDESIQDLADALDGKPIDVLLHNSGVYPREGQNIGEIDYDGWREALETNLLGTMRVDGGAAGKRRGQRTQSRLQPSAPAWRRCAACKAARWRRRELPTNTGAARRR